MKNCIALSIVLACASCQVPEVVSNTAKNVKEAVGIKEAAGVYEDPLSDEQEIQIGIAIQQQILEQHGPAIDDRDLRGAVMRVVGPIADQMEREIIAEGKGEQFVRPKIVLLASPDPVVFSTPDGSILLSRGLLENVITNESQLAAFAAFEIAHYYHRHLIQSVEAGIRQNVQEATLTKLADTNPTAQGEDWQSAWNEILASAYQTIGLDAEGQGQIRVSFTSEEEKAAAQTGVETLEGMRFDTYAVLNVLEALRAEQDLSGSYNVHSLGIQTYDEIRAICSEHVVDEPRPDRAERYEEQIVAPLKALSD